MIPGDYVKAEGAWGRCEGPLDRIQPYRTGDEAVIRVRGSAVAYSVPVSQVYEVNGESVEIA